MDIPSKTEQLDSEHPYSIPMLILFTGKGGVGKSTMSATTAIHHAQKGKKTILVSSDPAHSTDDVIGQKVGFNPRATMESTIASKCRQLSVVSETRHSGPSMEHRFT